MTMPPTAENRLPGSSAWLMTINRWCSSPLERQQNREILETAEKIRFEKEPALQ